MLLYPAALTDIAPIILLSSMHDTFVYFDGMPNNKYFKEGSCGAQRNTVELLNEELLNLLKHHLMYKEHVQINEDYYIFKTKGGQKIHVFWNTLIEEVFEKPILSDMLQHIDALFLQGYINQIDLKKFPKLTQIFTNRVCSEDIEDHLIISDPNVTCIAIPDTDKNGRGSFNIFTACSDYEETQVVDFFLPLN